MRGVPPVLTAPKTWRRERPANATRRSSDLTPEEQANVRRAITFLRVSLGGWVHLGKAMGSVPETVRRAMQRRAHISAGIALRRGSSAFCGPANDNGTTLDARPVAR